MSDVPCERDHPKKGRETYNSTLLARQLTGRTWRLLYENGRVVWSPPERAVLPRAWSPSGAGLFSGP